MQNSAGRTTRTQRGLILLAAVMFTLLCLPNWVFGEAVTYNNYNPRNPPEGRYAARTEPYLWNPFNYDSNNAAVNRYSENDFKSTPVPDPPYPETPAQDGDMSLSVPPQILPVDYFLKAPDGLVSTLQIMILLTVITLSPSIMIMTTSYIRVMTVLAILRQAIGTNQLPPSQVITALSLFVTFMVMMPVWSEVYIEAVLPFQERRIGLEVAWNKAEKPIRTFMAAQIERTGNTDTVISLLGYIPDYKAPKTMTWRNVPWAALLPGFMLSELKTAFCIGFQVYLPFLVLDMIISSVMVSMGMMMLPPVIISLPFKLMLFVLMDGWELVILMLLDSFEHYIPEATGVFAMHAGQGVLGFG
ncbi:MAG: flagellar type III secretion system pore protein FliP [Planctomycetaceae bacterium]|jgi:flagellar biosynthetic protein FliP|nr:flagellar type III secretion system pore protein FliP [Planctomycetaceae bacterium]